MLNKQPSKSIRVAIYVVTVALLGGIAWHHPFLFELPLIAVIGGAYWTFFSGKVDSTN